MKKKDGWKKEKKCTRQVVLYVSLKSDICQLCPIGLTCWKLVTHVYRPTVRLLSLFAATSRIMPAIAVLLPPSSSICHTASSGFSFYKATRCYYMKSLAMIPIPIIHIPARYPQRSQCCWCTPLQSEVNKPRNRKRSFVVGPRKRWGKPLITHANLCFTNPCCLCHTSAWTIRALFTSLSLRLSRCFASHLSHAFNVFAARICLPPIESKINIRVLISSCSISKPLPNTFIMRLLTRAHYLVQCMLEDSQWS